MLPLAALKNKKNSDQKHWHPIASLLGSTRGYFSENVLKQDFKYSSLALKQPVPDLLLLFL